MVEIDSIALVQVNATIITGLLILLTITNLVKKVEGFWMPKMVSAAVIPFIISSILALFQYTAKEPPINFGLISIGAMIVGFMVLAGTIIQISSEKLWKKK